jgi:phosphoribosyl-AMP cyclohydrolase / phosphoribosyl-ATP pyrophosphohydrolase
MDARVRQSSHKLPTVISLNAVRYDTSTGLVPVIVQDATTREVLMQAYANREALKRTLGTGQAWFWSRSRSDFWHKGATSGNTLAVIDVRLDCDGDSILYIVHPAGPACHTGDVSCFSKSVQSSDAVSPPLQTAKPGGESGNLPVPGGASSNGNTQEAGSRNIQPQGALDAFTQLWQVVEQRFDTQPAGSYTTYLFQQGIDKISKKVGEEAVEVVIAAKNAVQRGAPGQRELVSESADLLFHLLVLWKETGVTPQDVMTCLAEKLPQEQG